MIHIDVKSRTLDKREYLMIFFLFLIKTICCGPSSEPSHQDSSDEGSQHMFFYAEITKIYTLLLPNTPSNLEL